MGVNTDGEEFGPGPTVTDGVKLTEKSCGFEQETGNKKSLSQDTEGHVGIQDRKMAKGAGIPLITLLPNMPSQHASGALDTEHNEAQREHTDGEGRVLYSTPTLLRPDADIEDEKTELSQGALVNLNTDTSADDKCVLMEERTSSLQPGEAMVILETDANDDRNAMYTTLNDKSLSNASASKLELPFNPDKDQMDAEGYTTLYKAASEGYLEGVQDLISRGANPNKPSKGGLRPLHAAAQEGHTHIVDFLILQGADVNVKCELGETCLHTAAANGNVDILESFIGGESNVNVKDNTGWTPFNAAVQKGHLEAVQYLMTTGAKQNIYDGMTPLYTAAKFGHLDIVKFLISKLVDVNEQNDDGMIPLHGAAIRGNMNVMEYLIQQGSDVNKDDAEGWTPLNAAVQEGHLDAVKHLVNEGAKQNRYDGMTPLYAAAELGHLDIVDFFIGEGADVNEEDDKGIIPLHIAVSRGHLKVMEYLIKHGSDVNKKDNTGWTPLNAAVQFGHVEAVKQLMTERAEFNTFDGMTPLYDAAELGHLDVVKLFISNGADVNEEDDKGMIPLHGATSRGHLKIMEYLIQQGSDVNKKDNTGCTPLTAAVQYGHLEAVQYLMTKGAKLNTYGGMTRLFSAAHSGHLDIVKFFIIAGADVNEEDDEGMIPLHGAAIRGHMKVMKYLIQQGSEVNKKDHMGYTPHKAAVEFGHLEAVKYLITEEAKQHTHINDGMTQLYAAAKFGHLDIVKFFIGKGADVNKENYKGMIPLHGAAIRGHMQVMEYLIQQGSNVNKKDHTGWTPFNAAVQHGHLEAVKYLMTEGAKQARFDDMTRLYAAARFGHLDIVKFFIGEGADVNEEDNEGIIPLHGAAARGHTKVMEYLIQQGSDVNKKDCRGWTPLHAAVKNGHLEVIKVLLAEGARGTRFGGLTPLYIATQYDHSDVVNFLVSNGFDVNGRNECGKSPLHAASYNGNIDIVKVLIHHNANVNEQNDEGWTPLEAAAQEGHRDVEDYLALHVADMTVRDGLTPLRAAADKAHHHAIEGISSCRGDPDEEETVDPLPGGHHNLITRGYLRATIKDKDKKSRTRQFTSQVDNVEGGNDCNQDDIAKGGAGTHDDVNDGNKEHNPFIHAKVKYPHKCEQDPILDQMEAMKCTKTRKRDTISNGTDCSAPRGSQTWQYSVFDPPFLQTMETGGHLSEEPESRCHSLIDENREMRESSSSNDAGNDLPFNETSTELKSFLTNSRAVVHGKLYDRNHVSSTGTFSSPVRNIVTEHRTSVDRCPSILALVQTFLQMIIALAIILAGSPVLVGGSAITERVTLQAGRPGVVSFHLSWSPSNTSQIVPFYTLRLKSKPRPFCNNGKSDIEGFKSPSQLPRFTTSVKDLDTSPCVNLMIDNVETLDEGVYVLTAFWHSFENVRYETIQKEVDVQTPPGRAKCFITLSENSDYPYEIHCEANTGSVTTTLSCYQNDQRIDVTGGITDNGLITRRIFWLHDYAHFSCCSHDVTLHVNETTCNDFEWPPIKETTRQIVNTVPTSVTTPTPQVESHTESGACRQFMLPSLWHFTYIFVYILAFVTMY